MRTITHVGYVYAIVEKKKVIAQRSLVAKKNATRSCGCLVTEVNIAKNTTHNLYHTRAYVSWKFMLSRCLNKDDPAYPNYGDGGRGIRVCRRWSRSLKNFFEDMGERPEGYQIDRIDNNGHYVPQNCRWVTPRENCQNRRTSRYFTYKGHTKTIAEWSRRLGIPRTSLRRKWGLEE